MGSPLALPDPMKLDQALHFQIGLRRNGFGGAVIHPDGEHSGGPASDDVRGEIVADHRRVVAGTAQPGDRDLEQGPIRLADHDRV